VWAGLSSSTKADTTHCFHIGHCGQAVDSNNFWLDLILAHVKHFNPDNGLFHSSLSPLSFPKKLNLFAVFECQKDLLSLWELRQTCKGS